MRRILAVAVGAAAVAATVLLPPPGPVAADPTVTFEPPQPMVRAAAPAELCEPAMTGVVGSGWWTPTVTLASANHTATMALHAVCLRGTWAEDYDFNVVADTNENCAQGSGTLTVTSGQDSGSIGPFTGSGTLLKVGSEYALVFTVTPKADPTKRYLVTLHVRPDPAHTVVACNYGTLRLAGHGAIARV